MQTLATSIETSQRGHATFYPLMALAKAQGALEGRKAILFFSEGLQVPSSVEEIFQATISEANRANVSVYAIDARGLDTSRDARRRRRRARQGRPRQPAGDGQARRRRHVDGRSPERRPGALQLQVQHAVGAARAGRGHRRRADRQHQRSRQGPRPRHRGSGELLRDRLRAEERRGRRQLPQDRGQGGAQGRRRDLAQRLLRAAGQRRGAAAALRAAAARRRRHAAAARLRLPGRRVPLPRDDARPPVHPGDRGAGRLARGRGGQEGEAVPHPVHRDGPGQGRERTVVERLSNSTRSKVRSRTCRRSSAATSSSSASSGSARPLHAHDGRPRSAGRQGQRPAAADPGVPRGRRASTSAPWRW